MLIRDILLEVKSQLMIMVGKDPLGQALAQRLHREAIVLDSTQVWEVSNSSSVLKKLKTSNNFTFRKTLTERSFLFHGTEGWAAVYTPRVRFKKNGKQDTGVDLIVSTDQGIDVKQNFVKVNKDIKALEEIITAAIGDIQQVYIADNANKTDLAAMRLKRRTDQKPGSYRPGVTSNIPRRIGRETDLFRRSYPLIKKASIDIKRYLRTALRRQEIDLAPNVDLHEIIDMIDNFLQDFESGDKSWRQRNADILYRVTYDDITSWWQKFLKDAATKKFNYSKYVDTPGNNLTSTQMVEISKIAEQMLLKLILKTFFVKTNSR